MHLGMKSFIDLVNTKYEAYEGETWQHIAYRMAKATNLKYYEYFLKKVIVPQGGILFGLGRPGAHPDGNWSTDKYQYERINVSLSNCVVQSIREDSMSDIMMTGARHAKCYQNRMGVGCDLSLLRPRGDSVHNAAKSSSGAASFMQYFSTVCGTVGQQGRRGALMLTIDINHPDIEEFIKIKTSSGMVTNANISVKITDEFMLAVKNDTDFNLQWNNKIYKTVKAKYLWNLIINSAYISAEPGILFWDRVLERPHGFYPGSKPITTNPCSEIPLPDDDVCLLTSIYLPAFVNNAYTKEAVFDFLKFKKVVKLSVQFIDEVKGIDIQMAPYPEIAKQGWDWRRVGIGTHGLSDMFWRLGLAYGSDECIKFTNTLYESLMVNSYGASVNLAKEKGAFPNFDWLKEQDCNWLSERLPTDIMDDMKQYGRRNLQLNTIAPTGSISVLSSNCSSGIEPPFDLSYDRFCMGNILKDIPHGEWLLFKHLTKETKPRDYMLTSSQINPTARVNVQAAATNWLDHSCSSTINFLKGAEERDIESVYMDAWQQGCEGITVFVHGSREGIVSLQGEKKDRPLVLKGVTHKYGQGDWVKYITVTKDDRGVPVEIFISNLSDKFSKADEHCTWQSLCKLNELADRKGIINKFAKYDVTKLSLIKQLVINTTTLLRCSINISEVINCFDHSFAGSLAWYVKLALKSNTPGNMKELSSSPKELEEGTIGQIFDPMCVKGNCG
mgnify:CR=1 FL=1